ncbi:hypothetical protein [Crocosphaera sp. Alani8]|uniref:hypothetical protein n=1 Tax=Crocosphaera sp. Alani8 TaxID=3038952 RepID=UPI00313B2B12
MMVAWGLILILVSSLVEMILNIIKEAKKMHKIPCNCCQYFTNDYRLKCTVNPFQVSTEAAINCRDYQTEEN